MTIFSFAVWFNTPPQILPLALFARLPCLRRLQKFGIKPGGIINFLTRSSPIGSTKLSPAL
jgi:hypothetical protein